MVIAVYIFGADLQIVPYENENDAKLSMLLAFEELKENGQYDPDKDDGRILVGSTYGEGMEVVFDIKELEEFSAN